MDRTAKNSTSSKVRFRVLVIGTVVRLVPSTRDEGFNCDRYRVTGAVELRIERIGYSEASLAQQTYLDGCELVLYRRCSKIQKNKTPIACGTCRASKPRLQRKD